MKPLHLFVVGAAKAPYFRDAAAHYLTALRRYLPAEEHVVRDARASDPERRKAEEGKALLAKIPARDFAQPEDAAGAAVLLCSEAGRYITGTTVRIDGGMGIA